MKLGCTQSNMDPTLFYMKDEKGQLHGLIASHIDDFLHAGDSMFESCVLDKLRHRFIAGKIAEGIFTYIGFQLHQTEKGILIDQNRYVDRIQVDKLEPQRTTQKQDNLNSQELTQLRKLAGTLNWVVQGCRPDMVFELVDISTKFKCGTVADLIRAVKAVRYVKDGRCQIYFPNMGSSDFWQIVVFTDAALANLSDGISSMRAYIIFLIGQNGLCCPIAWNGNKIKRVVRSTIAAEALSLQEVLEEALYLHQMLV